jgi:hypothetical protein
MADPGPLLRRDAIAATESDADDPLPDRLGVRKSDAVSDGVRDGDGVERDRRVLRGRVFVRVGVGDDGGGRFSDGVPRVVRRPRGRTRRGVWGSEEKDAFELEATFSSFSAAATERVRFVGFAMMRAEMRWGIDMGRVGVRMESEGYRRRGGAETKRRVE